MATAIHNVSELQAIQNDPAGSYVLAGNIDASGYNFSPIQNFSGTFDGSGYAISGLHISVTPSAGIYSYLGLFGSNSGLVENVGLVGESVTGGDLGNGFGEFVGGLVGVNYGTITRCYTAGSITGGDDAYVGGLVGYNFQAPISESFSLANVTVGDSSFFTTAKAGGLVGASNGSIENSFAMGDVHGGAGSSLGGLVGTESGVFYSYATGAVTGGPNSFVGGLVGDGIGLVYSYATGSSTGGTGSQVGALGGAYNTFGYPNASYNVLDSATSLTEGQLKSGLPAGFDPSIWGISSLINRGFPYLAGTLSVNHPPVAVSDFSFAQKGQLLTVDGAHGVLANDFDADHDVLRVTSVNDLTSSVGTSIAGVYGTLTLYADGRYTYLPRKDLVIASNYVADRFSYSVEDGHGGTAPGTLIVETLSQHASKTGYVPEPPHLATYATEAKNGATDFFDFNGGHLIEEHSGGTVSWRNNNPGNITYVGQKAAIGFYDSPNNHRVFCIFATYADGVNAAIRLLKTSIYNSHTIDDAMAIWTGDSGQALVGYQQKVDKYSGFAGSTIVGSLDDAQLYTLVTKGIQQAEIFKPGTVTYGDGGSAASAVLDTSAHNHAPHVADFWV
jgi:hypothetical protein